MQASIMEQYSSSSKGKEGKERERKGRKESMTFYLVF